MRLSISGSAAAQNKHGWNRQELLYSQVNMQDPLHRLYKTKLTLLAVVLTLAGLGLLIGAHWVGGVPGLSWLAAWPLTDLGSALFTTGLVVVGFEYVDGQDSEERASQRLRAVLQAEAPAIRDAVIDGFAFKQDDLARVATPETLDQIIRNSLTLRLGDVAFATEVYDDIRDQAIRAAERWHDVKVSIRLSMDRGATAESTAAFVATVRWEYSLIPQHQTRRFVAVSDRDEYRELAQDPAGTSAWYIRPKLHVDAGDRDAFELVQFQVDGEDRPIRRTARKGGQTYTVNLGRESLEADRLVTVSYTYRTLVSRNGHLLHFDIEQPTRGISVELDYSDTDISYVKILDFIASSKKSRILQTPATVPGGSIGVEFDGWLMPRSGVAFVWVLNDGLRKDGDQVVKHTE